jgi:membrane-associated phospholipid phosphatase
MHLRLGNFLMSHRVLIVGSLLALWTSITVAVTEFSSVDHLDAVASEDAQERMTSESTSWAEHVANLASTRTALIVTIVAAVVLLYRRHWHSAIALALVFPVTQGAVQLVKLAIERPRPAANSVHLAEAQGFSFPSAHSATSVAVYATIAFILIRASRHGHSRVAIASLAAALVLAVGFSRVLLGAHYPTDVLAGWTFGALVASLCWLLVARIPLPRPRVSLSA